MKVVRITNDSAVVELSRAELMIINNALTAVCHVVSTGDFHPMIGASPDEVDALREQVRHAFDRVADEGE